MRKSVIAGALALATVSCCGVSRDGIGLPQAHAFELVVTEAHIVRLRTALKLKPSQEGHWHSLEAALRALARAPQSDQSDGFIHRVRTRLKGMALDASAVRRVAAAARPLIASLDEDQKREGMAVVRALGVSGLF